jgi:hypothetical protein
MRPQYVMFLAFALLTGNFLCLIIDGAWFGSTDLTLMGYLTGMNNLQTASWTAIFTVPYNFFTHGFPKMILWDFSFFSGALEIVRWFLFVLSIGAIYALAQEQVYLAGDRILFKSITFKWNLRRGIVGIISVTLFILAITIVTFITGSGIMSIYILMILPGLIDKVIELRGMSASSLEVLFINLVPFTTFLVFFIFYFLLTFKIIMFINSIDTKIWNKIPNRIKGEPMIIKNNSARQTI